MVLSSKYGIDMLPKWFLLFRCWNSNARSINKILYADNFAALEAPNSNALGKIEETKVEPKPKPGKYGDRRDRLTPELVKVF